MDYRGSVRAAKYKGGFIGDIYFHENGFRKFALLEFFAREGFVNTDKYAAALFGRPVVSIDVIVG